MVQIIPLHFQPPQAATGEPSGLPVYFIIRLSTPFGETSGSILFSAREALEIACRLSASACKITLFEEAGTGRRLTIDDMRAQAEALELETRHASNSERHVELGDEQDDR